MNGLLRDKDSAFARSYLSPFTKLHEEIDHAMKDFYNLFESSGKNLTTFENTRLLPAIDLIEDKNCFRVEAEMPGMSEEDIKISAKENMLTIQGEKTFTKKEERKNYLSREINYGRYERSLSLPPNADLNKASASFQKGTLMINIPKRSGGEEKVHQIAVEKAKK